MAKSTLHARIAAWLISLGATEATSKSRKYRRFLLEGKVYWLGQRGALRSGATSTGSRNVDHLIPVEVTKAPIPRIAEPLAESAHTTLTLAHLLRSTTK